MKGSEIYDSIVVRCTDPQIAGAKFSVLFHSAVLCMAANPNTTDHDIYRNCFEREAVRYGISLDGRLPAPASNADDYNEPGAFLEPLYFYLPKGTEILNAHIRAYKNIDAIAFELWEIYELKRGIRGLTTITTYLMGDIVEAVRQLHDKHNKP